MTGLQVTISSKDSLKSQIQTIIHCQYLQLDEHDIMKNVGLKLIKEGLLDKNDLDFISQPLANREEYTEQKTNIYLKRKQENKKK